MRIERQHQKELPPKMRIKGFEEVSREFDDETAKIEASRCLNCKNAPCKAGCPVNIDIPEFIGAIKNGQPDEAYRIISRTNNLPGVCGRVCPQEEQCEKLCVRRKMEGAVAIGCLERYAAEHAPENFESPPAIKTGRRVAVVGSGPAGLTAAADLLKAGIEVTVFEALHRAGGVLIYGIPEFRLPKERVQKEIDKLTALGAKFVLNCVIGKSITIEQLMNEFDAVFIGSGAGLPQFLGIPGEGLCNVLSANEYLTRVNLMGAYKPDSDTPLPRGSRVFVFGAGNVALDAARTAVRAGASDVRMIYRRTRAEMPARQEEVRHAEEEGIKLEFLTAPVEFVGDNGVLNGVVCRACELGEPGADGRRSPRIIDGSDFRLDCDIAIIAIGTAPNPLITASYPQLGTGKKGVIIVDENTMETSVSRIYAGGDAVSGAATVIMAMGAGKKAAKDIIRRLQGNN